MPPLSTTASATATAFSAVSVAMASSNSPSSPLEPTIAVQPPASVSVSRRLPPPCWSHDETVALIEAYRDKWYSLRRGNLRATHWQEVADGVADRCPVGNPPKTSIQCRHKMEKLRKRYRAEIQRIGNTPKGHRYPSSWIHFKIMDSMELGLSPSDPNNPDEDEDDEQRDENEEELMLYPKGIKQAIALPLNRRYQGSIGNGNGNGNGSVTGNGVRIKIPNSTALPPPLPLPLPPPQSAIYHHNRSSFDDLPPPMNPNYASRSNGNGGHGYGGEIEMEIGKERSYHGLKRKEEDTESNVLDAMVAAIHKLGDGFVKMERMKMDMARELESMRMKMEMKRTEMILESQQKLVDSFSNTVMEKNKKMKRMPTPES